MEIFNRDIGSAIRDHISEVSGLNDEYSTVDHLKPILNGISQLFEQDLKLLLGKEIISTSDNCQLTITITPFSEEEVLYSTQNDTSIYIHKNQKNSIYGSDEVQIPGLNDVEEHTISFLQPDEIMNTSKYNDKNQENGSIYVSDEVQIPGLHDVVEHTGSVPQSDEIIVNDVMWNGFETLALHENVFESGFPQINASDQFVDADILWNANSLGFEPSNLSSLSSLTNAGEDFNLEGLEELISDLNKEFDTDTPLKVRDIEVQTEVIDKQQEIKLTNEISVQTEVVEDDEEMVLDNELLNKAVNDFKKVYSVKTKQKRLVKNNLTKQQKQVLVDILENKFPLENREELDKMLQQNLVILDCYKSIFKRMRKFLKNPLKLFIENI